MFHTTSAGVAVAVADTGPAAAVADNDRQAAASTHNQLLTFTSWSRSAGGAISIDVAGKGNCDRACWANAAGFAAGGEVGGEVGTQNAVQVPVP